MTRQGHIERLLRPITWPFATTVSQRRSIVTERHREVNAAMPLMKTHERKRAEKWKIEHSHAELWD